MYEIKIGIPACGNYSKLYKIYFEKLGFIVIESRVDNKNKYIDTLFSSVIYLEDKCDYIVFPKYNIQDINEYNNYNIIIHEIDNSFELFINKISNMFYIDKNSCKLAYNEAVLESLYR